MEYACHNKLTAYLNHLLASAGNGSLITPLLKTVICDHAIGYYRVLTSMGDELLGACPRIRLVARERLYELDFSCIVGK